MAGLPEDNTLSDADPAEGNRTSETTEENSQKDKDPSLECPICLQPCMHPVELPCHHVFCFLCIKGVAMQGPNSRCAICRATIPYSVLTNPHLKDVSQLYKEPKSSNGYQWYYESRSGGWWQYDERTMHELERAFSSKQPTCQLLLAGHLYVVDFQQMIQYRSNNRNISRRIKRGVNLEKRGVAGIRIAGSSSGAGSSGGGSNGSPPQSSAPTSRRRRGNANAAASSNIQTTSASGNVSSVGVSNHNTHVPSGGPHNASGLGQNNLPDSPTEDNEVVIVSDSDDESLEDEDYDSFSEEDDVDDDMEIGEEEEALIGEDSDERETEDEDELDTRDGARAPTRRSDRSNSSSNQTPPPPSGAGITNGASGRTYSPNSNGRGSRGARSGRNSGGGRSNNSSNGTASRAAPIGMSDPIVASSSQHSSSPSQHSSSQHSSANPHLIGQVNYGVSQTLNNIATNGTSASVKITLERHTRQEEYL